MTNQKRKFIAEYLKDLDGEAAATRCGVSPSASYDTALLWLADPAVDAEISKRLDDAAAVAGVTVERVVAMYWQIATADVSDLVAIHRDACRYCYGEGHRVQYIDEAEMRSECVRRKVGHFLAVEEFGGYGFDPRRAPASDCPRCFGRGVERIQVADTRSMSQTAKLLYDGAKQTKDGVEIKIRSRAEALEVVAKWVGMDRKKLEVTTNDGGIASQLTDEQLTLIAAINE